MPARSTKSVLAEQYDFALNIQPRDTCIIWPYYYRRGRPLFATPLRGRVSSFYVDYADEYICTRAHGPGKGITHTCGEHRCVNPQHLAWAQPTAVDTP